MYSNLKILCHGTDIWGVTEVKIGNQTLVADTGYQLTHEPGNPNAITIEILDFINYQNQAGQPIVVKYSYRE